MNPSGAAVSAYRRSVVLFLGTVLAQHIICATICRVLAADLPLPNLSSLDVNVSGGNASSPARDGGDGGHIEMLDCASDFGSGAQGPLLGSITLPGGTE